MKLQQKVCKLLSNNTATSIYTLNTFESFFDVYVKHTGKMFSILLALSILCTFFCA